MDRDFRYIQMVRRLVRDGRYAEARLIMKETNHPQIPALEARVDKLLTAEARDESSPPIITRASVLLGTTIGVLLLAINVLVGTYYLPFLVICFLIGFCFGLVMPEHERRRRMIRERNIRTFFLLMQMRPSMMYSGLRLRELR